MFLGVQSGTLYFNMYCCVGSGDKDSVTFKILCFTFIFFGVFGFSQTFVRVLGLHKIFFRVCGFWFSLKPPSINDKAILALIPKK